MELPEINKTIKFRTIYGWLIGRTINSGDYIFFVSDKIQENKHWCTFTVREIYEWEY